LIAWLGFLFADKVDVLNPNNLKYLNQSIFRSQKISLTAGGTHINPRQYNLLSKAKVFAFLGRFEPIKQGLRLMEMLPEINNILELKGHCGYQFAFYGEGSQKSAMEKLAASPSHQHLQIKIKFSPNPELALGEADVYFSLQMDSNYPSRALAEAMACGAFPIVTDNGETSEMFGDMPYYSYVPEAFEAQDIANALLKYLDKTDLEKQQMVESLSRYAKQRFVLSVQAEYFKSLYANLS
jgi:glycosyltransferase involved in cell wall biosynthesis